LRFDQSCEKAPVEIEDPEARIPSCCVSRDFISRESTPGPEEMQWLLMLFQHIVVPIPFIQMYLVLKIIFPFPA
jgi:hypothetical protein